MYYYFMYLYLNITLLLLLENNSINSPKVFFTFTIQKSNFNLYNSYYTHYLYTVIKTNYTKTVFVTLIKADTFFVLFKINDGYFFKLMIKL